MLKPVGEGLTELMTTRIREVMSLERFREFYEGMYLSWIREDFPPEDPRAVNLQQINTQIQKLFNL